MPAIPAERPAHLFGYGSTLRSDDGVGWRVAALAADDPRFAGVVVHALHQLAPELALDLSGARVAIFVDADVAAPPGTVRVRRVDASAGASATSHHVDAGTLLAIAADLYGAAPPAWAVGVGVTDVEVGEGLSPAVAAALPVVLATILDLLVRGAEPA